MPRPRKYDESALIAQAMEFFWTRGYRGTSIEELVSATGVNRASLYSAFPDKRELFIESIKRYLAEVVEEHLRYLSDIEDPAQSLRRFFEHFTEAPAGDLRRGCMLGNAAAEVGLRDRRAAALIRGALKKIEEALYSRIIEARDAGQLASHVQPRRYARKLLALLQGMRLMARVGIDTGTLKDAINAALAPLQPSSSKRGPRRAKVKRKTPLPPRKRAR